MRDQPSHAADPPGDPHELVTVYTVNEPTLAELLRAELEAEGIRCEVGGENQAGLAGILKVDLLVQAMDVPRARQILEHVEQKRREASGR